jgi:hypothetical protein
VGRLDEFDAIAKGIAKLEALETRNWRPFEDLDPSSLQLHAPAAQASDLVSDVRFRALAVDAGLDSNVHLAVAHLKPEPAPPLQACRLLDFNKSQSATVEIAGLGFHAWRDCQLDVMNAFDHSGVLLEQAQNK